MTQQSPWQLTPELRSRRCADCRHCVTTAGGRRYQWQQRPEGVCSAELATCQHLEQLPGVKSGIYPFSKVCLSFEEAGR